MANAKSSEEKAVFNGRQLALKISANSIYGFCGAVKMGKYHCLGVADCTTFRAREMLYQTQTWVKEMYNCDVIYGDTDSVMVLFFDAKTREEAFELGDEAADKITERFAEKYTKDIVLEMEKVYEPYLLMRKKRYAGLMYEKSKTGEIKLSYLDAKGIELVRRDNCLFAKRVQSDVLDALMYKKDKDAACEAVHKHMIDVVENKLPLSDYKLSKSRRKTYVNEDLPHIKVVEKMKERNPGSEPQVGDRVPFVLIETDNLKAKTFEKAEDPKFVEQNPKLKIDRLYYVEHQVVNSICGLLALVVQDPKKLFEDHLRKLTLQRTKQNTIMSFFQNPVQSESMEIVTISDETIESSTKRKNDEDKSKELDFEDAMMNIRPTMLEKKPKKTRIKK